MERVAIQTVCPVSVCLQTYNPLISSISRPQIRIVLSQLPDTISPLGKMERDDIQTVCPRKCLFTNIRAC